MSDTLDKLSKKTVLLLNKHWIAINKTTPKHAFSLIYSGNAKPLHVNESEMLPLSWEEWLTIKPEEDFIKTTLGKIKIPKVLVLSYFDKIPVQTAKFTNKNLWSRDNGICQYTGKKINKETGNIDHIIPKSRGGKTSWDNCVIACKQANATKGDRTPEEAGLKLLKKPSAPKTMPVSFLIKNEFNIPEWDIFISNIKK